MDLNGSLKVQEVGDLDRTESDATHFRLRQDIHPSERITCLSCGQVFTCSSLLQIYEHFSEQEHTRYFGRCFYCKGKVHQFCRNNDCVEIYHNCLRWKRGEDT